MIQAHTSKPCEKLGYTIGIGLAQGLANSFIGNVSTWGCAAGSIYSMRCWVVRTNQKEDVHWAD